MTVARSDLRATLRAKRRALGPAAQARAELALDGQIGLWTANLTPGTAAAYVATDGEISPGLVVERLRGQGWKMAFPRIADDQMTFHVVSQPTSLVEGRWGLLEPPASAPLVVPQELDLVLTPLVGFDWQLNRLGRGKAFYDRAFAFLVSRKRPARPLMVGLAHEIQEVDALAPASHDVALDTIVTPTRVFGEFGS